MSHLACSEARKAITSAMSSGLPTRPRGAIRSMSGTVAGVIQPVSVGPGETMFTAIPNRPISPAAARDGGVGRSGYCEADAPRRTPQDPSGPPLHHRRAGFKTLHPHFLHLYERCADETRLLFQSDNAQEG